MQLAQSYLQGQASPFDGVLEAYGQGQIFRQNKDLLQAQQAEQARKIQAQQQLETLDWDDMGAVSRVVAQFPEYTKGAQDYYKNMEAKEQQAMLFDMSASISALGSDRPDVAVQKMRDKANDHRDAGNEEKAEEYSQMAEWMARDPSGAKRALTMNYAVLAGKDAGAAFKSYTDANIAENESPYNIAETQAKTITERVTAAGGVNKLISTAALTDNPNAFMGMIDTAYDMGLIAPEKYNSLLASVSGDGAEAVATLRQLARGNPDIIKELLPQINYPDLGDGISVNSFDPQSGEVQTLGTMEKGVNPNQRYSSDANIQIAGINQEGANYRTGVQAETARYGTDTQAETARQSRELQAYLAEQKAQLSSNEFTQKVMPDGRVLLFNKQGQWKPVLDTNGKPMISKPSVADKPLNESQANALMYGKRMQTANKILEGLESSGTIRGWSLKGFKNEEQRKYEQAQRNFVNAVLRKESGAAIGKDEFDSAKKQYFPAFWDSEDVIKQKAATRRQVTDTMLSNVGPQGEAAKKTKSVKTNDLF